jgi:hypothetical protein
MMAIGNGALVVQIPVVEDAKEVDREALDPDVWQVGSMLPDDVFARIYLPNEHPNGSKNPGTTHQYFGCNENNLGRQFFDFFAGNPVPSVTKPDRLNVCAFYDAGFLEPTPAG